MKWTTLATVLALVAISVATGGTIVRAGAALGDRRAAVALGVIGVAVLATLVVARRAGGRGSTTYW